MKDAKTAIDYSGYFVVAFVDLLGTNAKNTEIKTQPEFPAEMLKQEVDKVKTFQRDFDDIYEGEARVERILKSQRPADLGNTFQALQGNPVTRYAFSDSLIFFASLNTQQDRRVPMDSCFRILAAIACAQLWSLARGCPFRGGVEIGRAAVFDSNQILGPALSDAVKLEKQAQFPRILIGEEASKYFALNSKLPLDTPENQSNRAFAEHCISLICESDESSQLYKYDEANRSNTRVLSLDVCSETIVALIGERHPEQLSNAKKFAENQIQRFTGHDEKLTYRYRLLLSYLEGER